jgi:hypothetical protein
MLRRSFLAAMALLALLSPASAAEDPVAVIRELYRVHAEAEKTKIQAWMPPHRERFFTKKLGAAIARAYQRNEIGFDFIYDGQDFEIKDLEIAHVPGSGPVLSVEARFKNFGKPQRLVYTLAQEDGAWRIVDIRQHRANGWVLTKLLAKR